MALKSQLVQFLAQLPEVDSPDKRKALIMLTDLSPLAIYLDWQGSNMAFFPRLIDEICKRGQASMVTFLEMLSGAPQVQGQERQEMLAQLRQDVAALSDSEWQTQFAVAESAQTAGHPPDVDMLTTSIVSSVLAPYFALEQQESKSSGAAQLAQRVHERLRTAVAHDGGTLGLLTAFEQNPQSIQTILAPLVRRDLAADDSLAQELATLFVNAETEDAATLRAIIAMAHSAGTMNDSLVAALLGRDALPTITAGADANVVGDASDNRGTITVGGQHHHGDVRNERNVFNQAGQTVRGNQTNVAGNVEHVDNRHDQSIRTDGGAYIGGNVSTKGDFVGRDKVIHGDEIRGDKIRGDKIRGDKIDGDKISVGNISGSSGVAIGRGASASVSHGDRSQDLSAVVQIFQEFYAQIAQSSQPLALQAIIRQQVQMIEMEVQKGGQADEQAVEDAFVVLNRMDPEICSHMATTLSTPVQGLPQVVQRVARRTQG